jgi:purine-nucleoside phosphorylase
VPEVIVASQEGIRVLGLSIISNMASGIAPGKLNHSEVLENMSKVSSRLIILLEEIVKNVL